MKLSTVLTASGSLSAANAAALPFMDTNWAMAGANQLQTVFGAAAKWLAEAPIAVEEATLVEVKSLLGSARDKDGMLVNRLIDTGATIMISKSEAYKMNLLRQGQKFMDITDHYEFYEMLEQEYQITAAPSFPQNVSYSKQVHKLLPELTQSNMHDNLANFSSFHTRYYKSDYGLQSSLWLFEKIKGIAAVNPAIKVFPFSHAWPQKSVIARIPGKNAHGTTSDPVVIVSAHLDSTNLILPSILPAPGADDNGSGSVTILEAFRVLVESGYEPENTLEFHWYSAEEGGLLGSQDVLTSYKKDSVNVKAQLQQDMTGYVPDKATEKFGVITDFVSRELTDFVELIISEYTDIPYAEDVCGYACSDHASGTKVGYPSAFVIETLMKDSNHYIHSTKDTIDKLDFDHMEQHARLTLGFAYELGKHRF